MKGTFRQLGCIAIGALWLSFLAPPASAQTPDEAALLEPDAPVTSVQDWDKVLDFLNKLAWRISDSKDLVTDFSGVPLEGYWDKYVLTPEARKPLDELRALAQRQSDGGDEKALQATLAQASKLMADQKYRAMSVAGVWTWQFELVRHKVILQPWLARATASDRAFADEQAHALHANLAKVLQDSMQSKTSSMELSKQFLAATEQPFASLNAERKRLVLEQSALPNPIPLDARVRDKLCPTSEGARPVGESNAALAPDFPSSEAYYPQFAKRTGIQGATTVRVRISETGCAQQAEVVQTSGVKEMDEGALDLAMDGRYIPRSVGGQPTVSGLIFRVKFELKP